MAMVSLNLARIKQRMEKLNDWSLDINMLVKEKHLKDFKEALWYVNKVGELADKAGHYPLILINGRIVRISLTTMEESGLTDKDFDLAEEIDKIQ